MFFPIMPGNTTCGWSLGFTQFVSCAIVYVHTNDHNLRPMFFPTMSLFFLTMSWNNLCMVTRIHSACKFCYYLYTNDRNLIPIFILTNIICGWWLGFTQRVSYAIVYLPMIIIWDPCSFWLYLETQFVDGDLDSLRVWVVLLFVYQWS